MFNKRLHELRKSCKLSQQALGEKLGLTNNSISQYELGIREPSLDTLIKLSKIFEVSIDYLLGLTDSDENQIVKVPLPLSDDEQRLLDIFRKCSPPEKEYIIAKALVVSYEESPVISEQAAFTREEPFEKDTEVKNC